MSQTRKLSILVVSQYYHPEQFRINDMCEEWVRRGYGVSVITGIPNYPQGAFYSGYGWFKRLKDHHNGVRITRLPIVSRGSSKLRLGLNYISFVVSGFLWQAFSKQRADVVFSFEVSPMTQVLPAVWFAKRRKVPCIAYIQDLWPESFVEMTGIKSGCIIRAVSRMTDYIYRNCSKVLVTSRSFKKVVEARGVPSEQVVYWPQYAEEYYRPTQAVSPLVPKDDMFTIAFTGNIGHAQGLEILPEAVSQLLREGIRVRFLMVGEGRALGILQEAVQQKDVENSFCFIPRQSPESIPAILAGASAAFLSFAPRPLFAMTIPAKLQSYMACEMAILAVAEGETERIVEEAECGLCSKPGDAISLVSNIKKLVENPALVKRYATNARSYAVKAFNRAQLMDTIDMEFSSNE